MIEVLVWGYDTAIPIYTFECKVVPHFVDGKHSNTYCVALGYVCEKPDFDINKFWCFHVQVDRKFREQLLKECCTVSNSRIDWIRRGYDQDDTPLLEYVKLDYPTAFAAGKDYLIEKGLPCLR